MIALRRKSAEIDPAHCVVFYPTFGRRVADGWDVQIHGAVFREGVDDYRKRLFMALMRRVLKATPEELDSHVFRSRIAGFLLREQPGRQLSIQLGDERHLLAGRTRRNGHVRVPLRLHDEIVDQLAADGCVYKNWLDFRAATSDNDGRCFAGAAQLIPPTGVSVISDIDDTLKHTAVGQRRLLLANTFFNDFLAIDGMAGILQRWAGAGAAFHYVSSSPWQLYHPLQELLNEAGYPRGTMHLKSIRFRDPSVLRLFIARRLPKRRAIASIIKAFPQRQFILIGDSGEKDPEIYGHMARKYPRQVRQIYIRNLEQRPIGPQRAERAFHGVRPIWQVFRDPAEIAEDVDDSVGSPH